ncbi:MAG: tyrosine-type recombinase/integrase, partial [Patescibacteria group bacterium]|nr:tyrosine-type recombinase/integrase [Patescibacteria group bacterium]
KWTDVDTKQGILVLKEHKTAAATGKDRVVPLTQGMVRLLMARRREGRIGTYVFLNSEGSQWKRQALAAWVARARREQGISKDAKIYGLRHRFGTMAIVNGVDIKTLSVLMGHASTKMTEHYTHITSQYEHLASSMRKATRSRRNS